MRAACVDGRGQGAGGTGGDREGQVKHKVHKQLVVTVVTVLLSEGVNARESSSSSAKRIAHSPPPVITHKMSSKSAIVVSLADVA